MKDTRQEMFNTNLKDPDGSIYLLRFRYVCFIIHQIIIVENHTTNALLISRQITFDNIDVNVVVFSHQSLHLALRWQSKDERIAWWRWRQRRNRWGSKVQDYPPEKVYFFLFGSDDSILSSTPHQHRHNVNHLTSRGRLYFI